MPKEQRKRGRRAEKKRKLEKEEQEMELPSAPVENEYIYYQDLSGDADADYAAEQTTFYGLLTEEEQEYFRRADEILELDQFSDADEKAVFINNLYREAAGKELKIAHSQGCSRLLERLMLVSTAGQLKRLMKAFTGHVLNLVKHRFASHCCETLFLSAAPVMSKEMDVDYVPDKEEEGDDAEIPTMEILFLDMLNDIRPELRMLVTDTFGSHVVRTLLLILSGRPVSEAATVVQSRKKESVVAGMGAASEETRVVPRSFYEEVRKVLKAISEGFTKDELRRLAVHPIGSPTLQVVLQIDLGRSKKERRNAEGSVVEKLAGINDKGKHDSENSKSDKTPEAETDSDERQFFRNLLYDPVGSHLAEHLVKVAPKKEFNILYKKFFKSRLGSLARNETAAFVVQRILEKLVAKELEEAVTEILPQVPSLMDRSRVSVLKTLIDSCIMHSVDATAVAKAIAAFYDYEKSDMIFEMLHLSPQDLEQKPMDDKAPSTSKPIRDPNQLHGSLLAQTILDLPSELYEPVSNSLLSQSADTLVGMCKHSQASHVVQKLLNAPHATMSNKRKLLNILKGRLVELALDTVGSHIVDECWRTPTNYRVAIAEELAKAEVQMRDSYSGRTVWRNWSMDKYKTNRQQWFALGKEDSLVKTGGGCIGGGGKSTERKKTAVELARERHAAMKARGFGTGSNKRAAQMPHMDDGFKKQRVQ